jgi:hypothetical protein
MTPLANTPYIFPSLADNRQLRGPELGCAAGVLELAAAERGQRAEICLISSLSVLKK